MAEGSRPGPARRKLFLIVAPVSAAFVALVAVAASSHRQAPARGPVPGSSDASADRSGFTPLLSGTGWEVLSEGDFENKSVESSGARLRFLTATRGTRSDTVKYLGVRSRESFRLSEGTVVSLDLDWNRQANGTHLSAGFALAPTAASANPSGLADGLRIEYIGVPPGKNARMVITTRVGGRESRLFTEGWPDSNREGRRIGLQHLQLVLKKSGAFSVVENGRSIFESREGALTFDAAYLYLHATSQSGYPPREIFFDNVRVDAGR